MSVSRARPTLIGAPIRVPFRCRLAHGLRLVPTLDPTPASRRRCWCRRREHPTRGTPLAEPHGLGLEGCSALRQGLRPRHHQGRGTLDLDRLIRSKGAIRVGRVGTLAVSRVGPVGGRTFLLVFCARHREVNSNKKPDRPLCSAGFAGNPEKWCIDAERTV